jgi:uncharacterized protein YuzE
MGPDGVEAIYLKFKKDAVYKSIEVGKYGEAILDLNSNGELIGIEMLEPGTVSIRTINKIKKDYNLPALNHIHLNKLQEAFI